MQCKSWNEKCPNKNTKVHHAEIMVDETRCRVAANDRVNQGKPKGPNTQLR